MATAALYADRKVEAADTNTCLRAGCGAEPADDSSFCAPHRDAQRAYQRAYKQRLRRRRARQKLCLDCGVRLKRPRRDATGAILERGERTWCKACRRKRNRPVQSAGVNSGGEKSERLAAATRTHQDGRTRYHGQQKRGNQPHWQLDAQDRGAAERHIAAGFERLEAFRSPEVQAMPRIQRESVRVRALHEIDLGTRFLDDVLERHGHFKSKHGKRDGE